MWNPFKESEENKAAKEQKLHADFQMAASTIGPTPTVPIEEQQAAERRDILVQLQKWQQDRSKQMQALFLQLSGYQIDKDLKLTATSWNKGYVSLRGAAKLVNFIEPLDHNVMLANWDDKNLVVTMRDAIAHPLRRYLFMNNKELEMELVHAEYVFWLIVNTVEPNYRRGWNNGERLKDSKIIKVNELHNPYMQLKKKGIFGIES